LVIEGQEQNLPRAGKGWFNRALTGKEKDERRRKPPFFRFWPVALSLNFWNHHAGGGAEFTGFVFSDDPLTRRTDDPI
jgi:hypothetical protein